MVIDKYDVKFDFEDDLPQYICQIDLKQWMMLGIDLNGVSADVMRRACPCVGNALLWTIRNSYVLPRDSNPKLTVQKVDVVFHGLQGQDIMSPCATSYNPYVSSSQECAYNFKTGRCKCPLMAGVVGPHLLPNVYGKQK